MIYLKDPYALDLELFLLGLGAGLTFVAFIISTANSITEETARRLQIPPHIDAPWAKLSNRRGYIFM